ncbi:kinase-like domain-containing protein, partial [Mucidula mucida]
ILEISEGIQYLHDFDPPVVDGDIKGANIPVKNDLVCCLEDFGLTLLAESHAPGGSAIEIRWSLRWLPPEMMDQSLFQDRYLTVLDIYSFGCTMSRSM